MHDACNRDASPTAQRVSFKYKENSFKYILETTPKTAQETTQEILLNLSENQLKILNPVKDNSSTTQKEIAKELNIIQSQIIELFGERYTKYLEL